MSEQSDADFEKDLNEKIDALILSRFTRGERRKDLVEHIISALTRAREEEREWLPIETAPKDTTELLGRMGPKHFGLIWYFAPSSQTQGWCDANGKRVHPTHWLRIPKLPLSPPETKTDEP